MTRCTDVLDCSVRPRYREPLAAMSMDAHCSQLRLVHVLAFAWTGCGSWRVYY